MSITLGRGSYCDGEPILHWEGGEVRVGNYTSIAKRVTFLCGGAVHHACVHHPTASTYPFGEQFRESGYPLGKEPGPVVIGSDCWIGAEAMVFGGVTIGDGAIVGARSVITKDVPPFAVVAGNPARLLRMRYEADVVAALLRLRWWEWPEEKVAEAVPKLVNIEEFLRAYLW